MNDRGPTNPQPTASPATPAQPAAAQPAAAGTAKPAVAKSAAPQPTPGRAARGKGRPRTTVEELDILIRARYPIIYLVSWEEERVEQYLAEIAERRKKKFYLWT